jgi:hypothetical protein
MGGFVETELVECKGIAQIKHSTTGIVYDIDGSELVDWECISYGELDPINGSTYECQIEHPDLGLLIWQCGYASSDPDIGEHILVNDFKEFDIIQYDDRNEPDDIV